jgi:hypothetical protein
VGEFRHAKFHGAQVASQRRRKKLDASVLINLMERQVVLFLGIEEGDLPTGISLRGVVSLRTAIGQKLHGSCR